MHLPAATV